MILRKIRAQVACQCPTDIGNGANGKNLLGGPDESSKDFVPLNGQIHWSNLTDKMTLFGFLN
jgi:hypothetical protein